MRLVVREQCGLREGVCDGQLEQVRVCLERCAYLREPCSHRGRDGRLTEEIVVYARERDVGIVLHGR